MPPTTRSTRIARVLAIVFALNLAVAVAKLLYGLRAGAIALTADGVHSLVDAAANVVGLIGLSLARRPPDANHPYGHRKYETFAAIGIVMFMFLGCFQIVVATFERIRHARAPNITPVVLVVVGLTILVNLIVVAVERREGRAIGSELLLADAAHTGSDVLASVLVLASFAASRLGFTWADPAAAVIIVALILRAGFEMLQGTLSTLSDERRIPPRNIEEEALREPDVLEAHNVRTRGPYDDIHLDMHILVNPRMPIAKAHAVGHRVEARLRGKWPGLTDVVVHVEPAHESERATTRQGGGLKAEG